MIRRFAALVGGAVALHLTVAGAFALPVSGVDTWGTTVALDSGAPESSAPESGALEPGAAEPRLDAPGASVEGRRCPDARNCPMPELPGGCPPAAPCPSAVSAPAGLISWAIATPRTLRPGVEAVGVPHTRLSPPELPPPRS